MLPSLITQEITRVWGAIRQETKYLSETYFVHLNDQIYLFLINHIISVIEKSRFSEGSTLFSVHCFFITGTQNTIPLPLTTSGHLFFHHWLDASNRLVPLIVSAKATPILGTVTPSHVVGGTHPPTHWPLPHLSLSEGGGTQATLPCLLP